MGLNNQWMQRDLSVLWHPCTQMKDHEHMPVIPIQRGEGVWLHDFEGNRYLDAVCSWWVNIFGHANPYINQRVKDKLDSLFACEQADISPDFLCLSKALTGGYLPMAVCMTTDKMCEAFYDDYVTMRAFLHSHSYTGNPLACAAALATRD